MVFGQRLGRFTSGVLILTSSLSAGCSTVPQDRGSTAPAAAQAVARQQALEAAVRAVRAQYGSPALAALVWHAGDTFAAVDGVRVTGYDVKASPNDKWHIGSCGKAMTATLVAREVEAGRLTFDTKLSAVFPELEPEMKEGWGEVTVRQLLNHTAGIDEPEALEAFSGGYDAPFSLPERRLNMLRQAIAKPLLRKPGAVFKYSNLGYAIAGAVVERVAGDSFERLLVSRVFEPLGMKGGGLGAPAEAGWITQPYGHRLSADKKVRIPIDPRLNHHLTPPEIAPAGDIYMELASWLAFGKLNLDGAKGLGRPGFLKAETFGELFKVPAGVSTADNPPQKSLYALGWGVVRAGDGRISQITHTGGDNHWLADIRIFPQNDLIVLTVTNDDGSVGEPAVLDLMRRIRVLHGAPAAPAR